MVSDMAEKIPNFTAVSSWDGEFTYAEVESLSTRLAHKIISLGSVKLGDPIPLCFEKSRWTVIALLAVLKAGSAFVLTDPAQPEGRLRTIVTQTGATVLLASSQQENLARGIASPDSTILVVSDSLLENSDNNSISSSQPSLPQVPADSTMYIIFTSGTTAAPKGIQLSHANFTSGAIPRAKAVGYGNGTRVFEFASYAFDVAIDCILCTLANGGTVCVPSDRDRVDDLGGAIIKARADMAHMTPSVARVLDREVIRSLKVLGLGGEAVPVAEAEVWGAGRTNVVVAYGPSECTVGCTVNNSVAGNTSTTSAKRSSGYATIGTGVGAVTWIVDPQDHNTLVPLGAVGELLVEGPVVGIGYLNQPDKTAASFIENPPWLTQGHGTRVPGRTGRLYKTGDLVRYDPDDTTGAIVFVGRKDQQVKIRGQRVELVEIEHRIRDRLPTNGTAVELAAEVIKPSGGDPTLVVFISEGDHQDSSESGSDEESDFATLSHDMSRTLAVIDASLEDELPRYMLPTAYIPLHKMPALVSRKIDRKRLRELGSNMTRQQVASFRVIAIDNGQPETENEKLLHSIWKRILGVAESENISLGDSFFALGGDSLKAMKLVSAARQESILLTVAKIFGNPNLKGMASVAEKKTSDTESQANEVHPFSMLETGWMQQHATVDTARLCHVPESIIEDIYPCTPLQEALMALSAKFQDAYVAQRVMKLPDEDTMRRLQTAFETVSNTCPILRTRIVQVPGRGLVQVVVQEQISWRTADSLEEYLEQDRNESMDLGKPLVRYGVTSNDGVHHFIFTIHHSLYDGWSMPLIVDRVNKVYQGLSSIPPPTQFKHFIQFLNSTGRSATEDFWRERLCGATGIQFPQLPSEGYQTRADSLLEVFVPLDQSRSQAANTTVATIIRAAWALVAADYVIGSDDVVFGETLTGRNAPVDSVETIEGPMIATVPVRIRIDRSATIKQHLERTHKLIVQQMPHEHAGLQHIRRVSPDALEACELRTGLVLHPGNEDDQPSESSSEFDNNSPASGLVPADDAEAAKEALRFNTYALMLVCSITSKGFLVMASFDSNTVVVPKMKRVLASLALISQELCNDTDRLLADLETIYEKDRGTLTKLSSSAEAKFLGGEYDGRVDAVWVVDQNNPDRLLPWGATGELLLESSDLLPLTALTSEPKWHSGKNTGVSSRKFYKTEQLARFEDDGTLLSMGKKTTQLTHIKPSNDNSSNSHSSESLSAKQITLRSLWARVLRTEEQSIRLSDSFFRVGGDSISAMKLVSEARLEGLQLTVGDMFAHRSLAAMASVAIEAMPPAQKVAEEARRTTTTIPYASLDVKDIDAFIRESVRPKLQDSSWTVVDIFPVLPLQEIAIRGTVQLPRYSLRYEMMHFDGRLNTDKIIKACQELVAYNEILRTVFVEADNGEYFAVVLEQLVVPVVEFDIQTTNDSIEEFAHQTCQVDVQQRIPASGSPFVKFFLIHDESTSRDSLIFRLSHAQYDEMCLPIMLQQLRALYSETISVPVSVPFSAFVNHVHVNNHLSLSYWRSLLDKAPQPATITPDISVVSRRHYAVQREVDISEFFVGSAHDCTAATLPTAAWALTLSRHLGVQDVVFGEVVGGRSVPLAQGNCEDVTGPCWQYVPVRVKLDPSWTGVDLLREVQRQHVESSSHEGLGLAEIVRECTDWSEEDVQWFGTVVHQAVTGVEKLEFGTAVSQGEHGSSTSCTTEPLYLHEEPLREWKIQAFFVDGKKMILEIVTVDSWKDYADKLLDELVDTVARLVLMPGETI
jgi:amino acid adenylation domain-containing protein